VTHLPSGLAVVTQVRALAVALAFVDRITGLTEWTAQNISATPEVREEVRKALNHAYGDFYGSVERGWGCKRSEPFRSKVGLRLRRADCSRHPESPDAPRGYGWSNHMKVVTRQRPRIGHLPYTGPNVDCRPP
jgi:hypothetical protein